MTELEPFSPYATASYHWMIDAQILYRGYKYRQVTRMSPSDANGVVEMLNDAFMLGRSEGVIAETIDVARKKAVQESLNKYKDSLGKPRR